MGSPGTLQMKCFCPFPQRRDSVTEEASTLGRLEGQAPGRCPGSEAWSRGAPALSRPQLCVAVGPPLAPRGSVASPASQPTKATLRVAHSSSCLGPLSQPGQQLKVRVLSVSGRHGEGQPERPPIRLASAHQGIVHVTTWDPRGPLV